ncbi:MAG: F0F1 ATP synthase subunit epsilon [Dysgonamonadaceae bacterium]|jgi:F-type H+-transporting ATPase subunit epsilon|nr:F0F1 ATP synthase subunit epsilon [Dysgonamonadaceae bacterium]
MKLDIISPEKILYKGQAELVMLPGLQGAFTILDRHAPIISGLSKGTLLYRNGGKDVSLNIDGGFVEAKNNVVTVCIE